MCSSSFFEGCDSDCATRHKNSLDFEIFDLMGWKQITKTSNCATNHEDFWSFDSDSDCATNHENN